VIPQCKWLQCQIGCGKPRRTGFWKLIDMRLNYSSKVAIYVSRMWQGKGKQLKDFVVEGKALTKLTWPAGGRCNRKLSYSVAMCKTWQHRALLRGGLVISNALDFKYERYLYVPRAATLKSSVHHHTFNWINQQDAATSQVYYLSFKNSPTCFGHPHAHHQELQQLQ